MTELGLVVSNASACRDPAVARELLDVAQKVDADPLWDCLWVGDSLLSVPRLESLILLGACAARTERIRLGVGCQASLGLRDPILFMLQWASLDVISAGRMILTACTGGNRGDAIERELEAFHLSHPERVERMEESIDILRRASADGSFSFEGRHFHLRQIDPMPRFVQRPLPIWMTANPSSRASAGAVRRVLKRVVDLGDGWMTFSLSPSELRERLSILHQLAAEEGKTLGRDFPVCVYLDINVNGDDSKAIEDAMLVCQRDGRAATEETLRRSAAIGPPEACLDFIRRYVAAGATHIALRPVASEFQTQLETVTRLVAPEVKALVA